MNQREIEELVDQILLKKARAEKLTKREEKILAYAYYAARPQRIITRTEFRNPE